jgi:glycosyltransferase involved in cell wall biosynthesis
MNLILSPYPNRFMIMQENVKLTILIPCLNEAKTLAECVRKAQEGGQKSQIPYEVLVSDNGSTDGSQKIAQDLGARVISAPLKGYGAALHYGFLNAKGEYILFGDGDDTYDFLDTPRFWSEVQAGHPVVIGTRIKGTIIRGAMPFLNRYIGTPILTFLIRWLYKIPITDCNSGMRLLSRRIYDQLKMSSPGMEYASEMLVKLGLLRAPVVEIPITLSPDRRGRPPHLRRWRDGWRHLRFILMYAPHSVLSRPGMLLYALGTILVMLLVGGPLKFANQTIDYHTQIAASTLGLIGFTMWGYGQMISFFSHLQESITNPRKGLFMRLSFEKKLVLGTIVMLMGIAVGVPVLATWIQNGFSNLSEIHRLVCSLYFVFSGFLILILALTLFTFDYPTSVPRLDKLN